MIQAIKDTNPSGYHQTKNLKFKNQLCYDNISASALSTSQDKNNLDKRPTFFSRIQYHCFTEN